MTFNIDSFAHMQDFDLPTKLLGVIRCGPLDASKKFIEFEDAIQDGTIDGCTLAHDLLITIARKLTGIEEIDAYCRGPALTVAEVAGLTQQELDAFCDRLWANQLGIAVDDRPAEGAHNSGKTGCEVIALALRDYVEAERTMLKRSYERTRKGVDSYLLKPSIDFSEAKFFMPPPSPILETNRSLGKLVAHSEQVAAKAEVDQAETKSLANQGIAAANKGIYVAIGIAAVGLAFSVFTWYDGRENAKKADATAAASASKNDAGAKKLQSTLDDIASTAKEDHRELANDLAKTRAMVGAGLNDIHSKRRSEASTK
jgi:hypothetical protein